MSMLKPGRARASALLPVLLALATTAARAQPADPGELVTDRPDQTESAHTVPRGFVQLETGATVTGFEEGGRDLESVEVPGTLLRVGLAPRFELRLGWSGWQSVDGTGAPAVDGIGDAELGAKVLLAEEAGWRPRLALLFGTSVPVGDDEVTSHHFDPSFRFAASHELPREMGLAYNLGMAWETTPDGAGGDSTLSSVEYTVALGFPLGATTGAFVELFGAEPASAPGDNATSFDAGLTWGPSRNLQLDVAAGAGLTSSAPDWFATIGVSVRWPH